MSKYQLVFEKNIARVESLSEIYIAIKDGEQKGGKEYKIIADAQAQDGLYYGKIVEFSPKINKPFLYPAMDAKREAVKKKIIEAVREAIRKK